MAEYALVNGERLSASQYTRDEWKRLNPSIKMLCCGEPGHVVRNNLGTQYFRHKPNSLCITQEVKKTEEHRFLETSIYTICRELGWNVAFEMSRFEIFGQSNSYWIADILANKNEKFVIFEIPILKITSKNYIEYNKKFNDDFIPSFWFFNIRELGLNDLVNFRDHDIQAVYIERSTLRDVTFREQDYTLQDFLDHVLKFKFE